MEVFSASSKKPYIRFLHDDMYEIYIARSIVDQIAVRLSMDDSHFFRDRISAASGYSLRKCSERYDCMRAKSLQRGSGNRICKDDCYR
jgi:hypothetical protein